MHHNGGAGPLMRDGRGLQHADLLVHDLGACADLADDARLDAGAVNALGQLTHHLVCDLRNAHIFQSCGVSVARVKAAAGHHVQARFLGKAL